MCGFYRRARPRSLIQIKDRIAGAVCGSADAQRAGVQANSYVLYKIYFTFDTSGDVLHHSNVHRGAPV